MSNYDFSNQNLRQWKPNFTLLVIKGHALVFLNALLYKEVIKSGGKNLLLSRQRKIAWCEAT